MKKIFILYSLFLFSCTTNVETPKQEDTLVSPEKAEAKKANELKTFKGMYIEGKFYDCDNNAVFDVVGSVDKIDSIYKAILKPYLRQKIVVEFEGVVIDNSNIIIKKIISAEQKYYKNVCIPYDFWCVGNEPFWQVQISAKENLIDFYDPMNQKYYSFNYMVSKVENKIAIYQAQTKSDTIKITINKGKCNDGMSDKEYNYSAEILLNGKKFKGCAIKYGELQD